MTLVQTQEQSLPPVTLGVPAVELRDAVKTFGSVVAVDGVSLAIQPGEIVALLGPNGAGKTTTIDMLLGLSRPTSGSVTVFGMSPRRAVARGMVSAVLQNGGLLDDYTVAETVRLMTALFASGRTVAELLDRAGIADRAGRRVGALSGGERQRLRFAMALAPDPDLLILDEPTTGMDVEGRRDFWAAIRADAAAGRTVIFATHYLAEADEYADRVVFVRRGRIVADGTPAEIKSLGTGRVVRATLPGRSYGDLGSVPGARSIEQRGDTVIVHADDSDAVARYLLIATDAHDVEITSRNIEDAFLALTSGGPA
ncbi:MAG TPA: ABC transporter ATP-binding protein [Micromonosporaceae bacterium]|nr:ABC transporter ATP-binding protein [Micromonosporaceae bacterium]